MAIYHKLTWNFDELPQELKHVSENLGHLLTPYYESARTLREDSYWDPDWIQNQLPASGKYTRYRLWNNLDACKQFVNQINELRLKDSYLQNIISEATIHQDDRYRQ